MAIPGIPGAGAVPSGQPAGDKTNVQQTDTTFTLTRQTSQNSTGGTSVQITQVPTAEEIDESGKNIVFKSNGKEIARMHPSGGFFSGDGHLQLANGSATYKFEEEHSWHTGHDNLNMCHFSVRNGKVVTDSSIYRLKNKLNNKVYNCKTHDNGRFDVELTSGQGDYVPFEQWILYKYNEN